MYLQLQSLILTFLFLLPSRAANVSLASLSLPVNGSAISYPKPPSGFDVDIHYDSAKILNPAAIYISAVEFVCYFAQKPWEKIFTDNFVAWAPGLDVEILLENTSGPDGPLQPTVQHIVTGLLEVMMDMSRQNKTCEILAVMHLQRRVIATLTVQTKRTSPPAEKKNYLPSDPTIEAVAGPKGTFTDREEPNLTISYSYGGVRANGKEVFTAILDCLANAAQYDEEEIFHILRGVGAGGTFRITIFADDETQKLTHSFMIKMLRDLILEIIVKLKRFGEMSFEAQWKGMKVAHGTLADTRSGPQALDDAR